MLTIKSEFLTIAEVNPPTLPDLTHLQLDGRWEQVLVTDNVFGKIRVSPYAYAARITHDVPTVHPTVVVSTRDRNVLAIESEVRGALGNGVDSFLVVMGDTFSAVEQLSDQYDVTRHLRNLQDVMPAFEVGMPARFDRNHLDRRIDSGAQFIITSPILDPATVLPNLAQLRLNDQDPLIYLAVMPPFSPQWIARAEGWGAVPATQALQHQLDQIGSAEERRSWAWQQVEAIRRLAEEAGAGGIVLMGMKQETIVGEAAARLRPPRS
jgi:5,10-methylenetetrahydrofolate reductase